MSYFPRKIMPLTPKDDSPLATGYANSRTRVTARHYNTHDEEIQAIGKFLGASDLFSAEAGVSQGILDKVSSIINRLNSFVNSAGGISVSSGNVRSGGRIIFPEPCLATPLIASPLASDTSITVNSTSGFPDSGIISILNDMDAPAGVLSPQVGFTNVEWIRYSGKTAQSFEGCERGYGGTMTGTHSLSPVHRVETTNNVKDYPGDSDHVTAVHNVIKLAYANESSMLGRHFPAWRRMTVYKVAILGLYGTIPDITWKISMRASWLSVKPTDPGFASFSQVAGGLGLLRQRNDGAYYLESNDISYALQGVLTWAEASGVVNGLSEVDASVNNQYWPAYSIPVFYGRLTLTLSPGSVTRESALTMDGIRLRQNATGEAYVYDAATYTPLYGDISYMATTIGSQIQSLDSQPNSNGTPPPPVPSGASGPSGTSGASGTSGTSGSSGTPVTEDPCDAFWRRYHHVHHWYHSKWWVRYCTAWGRKRFGPPPWMT